MYAVSNIRKAVTMNIAINDRKMRKRFRGAIETKILFTPLPVDEWNYLNPFL